MNNGFEAVLSTLGRAWGWILAFGLISIAGAGSTPAPACRPGPLRTGEYLHPDVFPASEAGLLTRRLHDETALTTASCRRERRATRTAE
jgi:hypothetical protein